MLEYDWPGNVRELENVLTHAAINTQGEVILEELIIPLLGKKTTKETNGKEEPYEQSLQNMEKEYITKILDRTHWHLGKTCKLLDISRPTLRNKLRTYGISPNK
jgi:two-component system response regulator AtoC